MHAMAAQVQQRRPHPWIRLLLPLLIVTAASAAGASPVMSGDLYALSKLKSSLLSRSARDRTSLSDWDIATPPPSSPASHRYRYCNFSGVTCDASSNRVVAINLTGVPLHGGVLPSEVSLLDALSSLTVATCSLSVASSTYGQ